MDDGGIGQAMAWWRSLNIKTFSPSEWERHFERWKAGEYDGCWVRELLSRRRYGRPMRRREL